jgi:hypothetical protein
MRDLGVVDGGFVSGVDRLTSRMMLLTSMLREVGGSGLNFDDGCCKGRCGGLHWTEKSEPADKFRPAAESFESGVIECSSRVGDRG